MVRIIPMLPFVLSQGRGFLEYKITPIIPYLSYGYTRDMSLV